jgi:hypothetical protein
LLDILKEKSETLMGVKLSCYPLYQDLKKLSDDRKYWAEMEVLGIMSKANKQYGFSATVCPGF